MYKDDFETIFADTYPKFTKNLVKHCDDLTYSEIRLCMLLRMGYPSIKILQILEISKSTLANLRSSVRHKFGLERSKSLTNFILCI